ncbi:MULTISPECIES: SDR family oxidoreductase [Pseudomonas syringae group]|uniref:Short chain dehydrogenase n=1 Tax=Pseudomonas syringae pv. maculicola TaxID=59511 RepID=A0A0N1JH66_PSEYM|nr:MULTISPECIES: SDR family oxidoreductase [Pseudomonas syringae group]KPC05587.1 Short chain dehydrogenase [Pseudomonas amygdali pv. lachrymans]EGH95340.1 short chain dehydrogenase [Pseudomonas amygdali pv. lachrymans str. M302278]KPB96956.1 Short chain dehydrogenase [Pseudomonas syringae pv. maculicola]KPB97292.1 Short chain dehydrogenase [Pseudomonas syringae pv. maculicola str. M6]KPX74723.1 Short chain dehydrogenase [Pseudomonas syringae pv. maculicola]
MPIALITGCSSGIGRALADAFKATGYEVWATARKADDVAALSAAGFIAVQLDVNDKLALEQLAAGLEHSGLDVLINNAGYGAMGPLLDGGVDALQRQFETNVFSVVGVTRALFPALRRNKGLVVNIGSVSGVLVTPFAGAYCASKAAVHALSNALRLELAPFGVQVMEVQPGAIASSFAKNASHEAEQLISEQSPWWPIRESIRARARASLDNPTPATEFARDLLKAVQHTHPPRLLRLGNGSSLLPLMAWLLPKGLLDMGLRKRFGLNADL